MTLPRVALLLVVGLTLSACRQQPEDEIRLAKNAVFEKNPQGALAHYHKLLEELEHDDSPSAQLLKARALRGAGDVYWLELRDLKDAVSLYRRLIQEYPEAPETLEARVILADLLQNHYHDLRGAISELTAALARNPPESAELAYRVAKLYWELGDYQQCELEAQRVATTYEHSPYADDAMFLRGQALGMMEGRRAETEKAFRDLMERFPDSELWPHALFELGKLKAEAGENDQAIALWVEALKRHPDPAVVQSAIARVRNRITKTMPRGAPGNATAAFDRDKKPPKSSIEAVGGSADEIAHERGGD